MKRAKKKTYHVLKLDLPVDVAQYISRLAKATRLTCSKIVTVILWMQLFRMEMAGELKLEKKRHGRKA